MPETLEAGRIEAVDTMSDAGIGGIADIWGVVVDPPLLRAPAAPCDPCGIGVELGEATEEAEPTAKGISGDCVWVLKTMLTLAWGGMSRVDAVR
jgi:hypothetical protein